MGTEVMHPKDCFGPARSPPFYASPLPRRKPHKAHHSCANSPSKPVNTRSNPARSNTVVGSYSSSPPNQSHSRYAKKAAEGGKKKGKDVVSGGLVMGDVMILKRGESLDEKTSRSISKEKKGRSASAAVPTSDGVMSSKGSGDLIVFGTGRLGPNPAMVPKQVRMGWDLRAPISGRNSGAGSGIYAGSACAVSPSPSALPLPSFPLKRQQTCAAAAFASFETSATQDLRRLLRLA